MRTTFLAATLTLAAALQAADPALRLPALISDHMVVQAGSPIRIWGWAAPGKSVSVQMAGKSATAAADSQGRFSASLPAMPAGGPFELSVAEGITLVVHDVLVGEVWLGSGQSNMEFSLNHTLDADKAMAASSDDKLRLFLVERHASSKVEDDCKGSWKLSNPESAGGFSAVAWHFGKNLRGALKAPVGMIASSWGGTPAEAWTPRSALVRDPDLASQVKAMESDKVQMKTWEHGLDFAVEVKDLRVLDSGGKALSTLPNVEAKNWIHSEKPGSKVELKASSGGAKLKGNVEGGSWASMSISPAGAGHDLDLSGAESIEFKVRGDGGKAILLLHQAVQKDWDDFGSADFEFGPEWKTVTVPVKSLKQGGWGKAGTLNLAAIEAFSFSLRIPFWPDVPELVYNGMIEPLAPFAIKGVLWYQGESNAGRANQYQSLLTIMIQSWRKAWGIDFPFLIVQLPNYKPGGEDWVKLRAAQEAVLRVPGTGMVKTMGLGDDKDIHPKNKRPVGKLLSDLALKQVYSKR